MLELANTFHRSLDRLSGLDQSATKAVVFDYMADPSRPGLSLHRVDRAKDKRFWTIRVNRDLRIVVFKDGSKSVFCYVGHHDDAYAWAQGRRFEVHPVTGAAQIVELLEIVREEIRIITRQAPKPGLLSNEDPAYLISLGVPEAYVGLLRGLDEDGLLNLLPRLPEEAQESVMALATGERPDPRPVERSLISDPFAHPDAQRRFWVAANEDVLAQALEKPWAEWLVFLHPSQRAAVERNFNGPARVSGSAGTGKSVVAMHRAAYLARTSPQARVLLTSFSKTLARRLSEGIDTLVGPEVEARERLEVTHLHAYAYSHASRLERLSIADDATINRLLVEARGDLEQGYDTAFLRAEWDAVIDYWGITSFDAYRSVPRTGRGTALGASVRTRLWDVFAEVRRRLAAEKLNTFGDICDRLRARIELDGAHPFDHVVVDEAQDLGPRELKLVTSLAKPGPRALFFAGDVGQRIFRWPFSWAAAGVDVRGRALRLRVNYRTSTQIKRFSDHLLPARVSDVDGEAEERGALSLMRGPEPELKGAPVLSGEIAALTDWLAELGKRGVPAGEIAIFARTRRALDERASPALAQLGMSHSWLSPDQDSRTTGVTLGTLHAAKGLEFRAVAVVACDDAHLPLRAALEQVSEPEAKQIVEERERNLLYVGCTRARDQLLVTWSGKRSRFLNAAPVSALRNGTLEQGL